MNSLPGKSWLFDLPTCSLIVDSLVSMIHKNSLEDLLSLGKVNTYSTHAPFNDGGNVPGHETVRKPNTECILLIKTNCAYTHFSLRSIYFLKKFELANS